ncbi:MAG: HAD-IIIA family hydrolase [Marmoricola sp.]
MTKDSSPLTTLVVPTIGRPSLEALLHALESGTRPVDGPVLLVDDRPGDVKPLEPETGLAVRVLRSGGRGPAAARNVGWHASRTPWVSFLDDDVLPEPSWYADLLADLARTPVDVAASKGAVRVPMPTDRRPTDWERATSGLETAFWITADMSVRRDALTRIGGFDERFRRAYREDADLALRLQQAAGRIEDGRRRIVHPVRPADDWVSLRMQAGNADDQLMRALHGPDWRERSRAGKGRFPRHLAVTGATAGAAVALAAGRRRAAGLIALGAVAGIGEFAAARIAPGPRDADEVRRMLLTSATIPFAATWHSLRGFRRHRGARAWRGAPDVVLFDRDGTLVHDEPYNGDPALVRPVPGAREALERVRAAGLRVGLVTNQSGIGRGLITREQAEAVNARVEELLGPFDVVVLCPHAPEEDCACRKPRPGMVLDACERLGVEPVVAAMIGDTGADVAAGARAGALAVLVPNAVTRREEIEAAPHVAGDLAGAVDLLLAGVR